mmetsp:Transcript_5261/g.14110  ORF Transcript_5261/g.14110 Transcript_5261/m.14110 type:complete len:294 (-) Transcript_5261:581-1462(-)
MSAYCVPTDEEMELVRISAEALAPRAAEIATLMYDKFYERNSDLMNLWSADFLKKKPIAGCAASITLQAQVQSAVVFGFMKDMKHTERIKADLDRIAAKHCSRHIVPKMYPGLGVALVDAIREVTEGELSEDVLDAWAKGYAYLSGLLIEMETQMYEEERQKENGFVGFKAFQLAKRSEVQLSNGDDSDAESDDESEINVLMEFVPVDGGALPAYSGGQYVCLRLDEETLNGITHRNYTLWGESNQRSFRLSLNKMDGSIVTAFLIDHAHEGYELKLSAPFGSFLLMETLASN